MKFVITSQEVESVLRNHFELNLDIPIEIVTNEGRKIRELFIKNLNSYLSVGKKINGIKYIKTVTKWGLYESKWFSEKGNWDDFINGDTVLKLEDVEGHFDNKR